MAITHKRELRKLVAQLGKERLTLAREPEHADALAAFCQHFGLENRGATLCAAVSAVLEKLLRPKLLQTGSVTMCTKPRTTGARSATQNSGWGRITETM